MESAVPRCRHVALVAALAGVLSAVVETAAASRSAASGACAASGASATSANPSGATPPASWWQFDRNRFTADETGGSDLSGLPLPATVSDFDVELVYRIVAAPALASSLTVNGSAAGGHWSAADGGMTLAALVRVIEPSAEGQEQWIAARWPDDASGVWRLRALPAAAGAVSLVADFGTDAGTVSVELPATTGAWTWVLLTIEADGGGGEHGGGDGRVAALEVRDLGGNVLASRSTMLPGALQSGPATMGLGRPAGGATGDVEVQVDIVAGWDGVLAEPGRQALVQEGGVGRYIEYLGGPGLVPTGRGTERVAGILTGDRRHVVMGDSFAFAASWNRVFPAILKVRRFEPFVGVATGLRSSHALLSTTTLLGDDGSDNPRTISQFEQYRCEWVGGTAPADVFGLPTNTVLELRGHAGAVVPADGGLLRHAIANAGMADGATGPLSGPGDPVAFRLVHRRTSPAVTPLESVRLTDVADATSVAVDLTTGAPRQSAATPHALVIATDGAGEARAILREAAPGSFAAAEERFATLATVMAWRVDAGGSRLSGQYYTSLHDSSWSWRSFGLDVESQVPAPLKSISREQLAAWLEATTIDPEQPLAFWWYVDTEDGTATALEARVRAAISMADEACGDAGLPRPVHLVVIPHLHQMDPTRTRDQLWMRFAAYRDGVDAIVDDPSCDHVARVSIFDATGGLMFDARPEAIAWLSERGYDRFTYGSVTTDLTIGGTLLDTFDTHPLDPRSAAFFASFVAAEIPARAEPPACPADATGDGTVDFADLLAVVNAWGPCPPAAPCPADVDDDGLVQLSDVLAVLGAWGACASGP